MERLAALEAEVAAEAEATRARRATALAKLRDQRVTQTSERSPPAEPAGKKRSAAPDAPGEPVRRAGRIDRSVRSVRSVHPDSDADQLEGLSGALELASKANRVKQELARRPEKGEKSWIKSGGLSLLFGPIGWLYAGSWREAVPATAGWILLAAIASRILPMVLLMPALMVALPLSAIAGVVYALQYNRSGKRQRLFDGDKDKQKQLGGG
jgi:hypothetical protein